MKTLQNLLLQIHGFMHASCNNLLYIPIRIHWFSFMFKQTMCRPCALYLCLCQNKINALNSFKTECTLLLLFFVLFCFVFVAKQHLHSDVTVYP